MIEQYSHIVEQPEYVVAEHFEVKAQDLKAYQTESALESSFIALLERQGYERVAIHDEKHLLENLRLQLEKLNDLAFTETEWQRLKGEICNAALSIEDKTYLIQKSEVLCLKLDNGVERNVMLIDKHDLSRNSVQVLNQYATEQGAHANRYDVTILVNGLPLVHVELKRSGVSIKEAFNQINRYARDSFWAGSALFEYIQIYIISNRTHTKYYSNSTRYAHIRELNNQQPKSRSKRESNSFEFTSFWADANNNIIANLYDFTETFLAKIPLLKILTRYCVFTVDKDLMVMRPYQIAATERILNRIQVAVNNKWQGKVKGGGYIWHTTGSGKTLTSFKTAQLATQIDEVAKILFVVDRQDLDYQTMREYNNFEPDCANGNANSAILLRQLNDKSCKIIITTIQKLSYLIRSKADINCVNDNVVFIFDECHRSQFGDMHTAICKKFKKYMLFGFTGTPILEANAINYQTTQSLFGDRLHCYTIINAINDGNVLKFKVDYVNTMKQKTDIKTEQVWGIHKKRAFEYPERIANVVEYILKHFDEKTKRQERYTLTHVDNVTDVVRRGRNTVEKRSKTAQEGFNALFATDGIPSAIAYYREFQRRQALLPEQERKKIAIIFTYAANEEEDEMGFVADDNFDNVEKLDSVSSQAMEEALVEYNRMFGTSYTLDGRQFQNYYRDLSLRMKNKEVDLLIVVDMFLTGFDAKCLNTLWVDKNLRMHGLLQAFSRTNRILNTIKNCGNIISFRNIEKETNESFAIFGDVNAQSMVRLRPFKDYYEGYEDKGIHEEGYKEIVEEMLEKYPLTELANIYSEEKKKQFVRRFSKILRYFNLLKSFDEFNPDTLEERNEVRILQEGEFQAYTDWYNQIYDDFKTPGGGREDIIEDLEFEMELVKSIQIDIDYILHLIAEYHAKAGDEEEIKLKIERAIGASPDMRDKKELIEAFINRITVKKDVNNVYDDWAVFVEQERKRQLDEIIKTLNLKEAETHAFMEKAFEAGEVQEYGMDITKVLPPMGLFTPMRQETKQRVVEKFKAFFHRFYNIG